MIGRPHLGMTVHCAGRGQGADRRHSGSGHTRPSRAGTPLRTRGVLPPPPPRRTVMTCPALTAGSMLAPPWVNRSVSPVAVAPPHPPAPATTATMSNDNSPLIRPILSERGDTALSGTAPAVHH